MQVYLSFILLLQYVAPSLTCQGRFYLNETYGVINHLPGDAQGKYLPSIHCEWLIDAGSTSKFITLKFNRMSTECSYDQLFVYDGQAYSSPMLGSFSGDSVPDVVTATSGYMLIHFFSDRNYVLDGFEAVYSVTDCPLNCTGQGTCVNHQCVCNPQYTGSACERSHCPRYEGSQCGSPSRGSCGIFSGKCECLDGYAGNSCSFPYNFTDGDSTWYTLAPAGSGFAPRAAHVSVFLQNALWTFGGHTLSTVLDDLYKFDFTASTMWTYMNHTNPWPDARYSHKAVGFNNTMFIYGGITSTGTFSDELWLYDVINNEWSLHVSSSNDRPPGLADHTLTLVDDHWLYVFGGQTENGTFVSDMYRIDILNNGDWEAVVTRGGNALDRRLVGHSAVYHKESRSILVYGGFTTDYARFSNRTSHLHAYQVDHNYWSQIYFHSNGGEHPIPPVRAYHTAHILGNYMLMYGGNVHIHDYQEKCYDENLHFYHLGCHMWVQPSNLEEFFSGVGVLGNAPTKGRFSHTSVVAFGDSLIVLGGYRGTVLGDLIAYKVPPSVAVNQNSQTSTDTYCLQYDLEACQKDPECVWCTQRQTPKTPGCIPRTQIATNCDGQINDRQPCLGICNALGDCGSCTVQGLPPNATQTEKYIKDQCAWCVKESVCQKQSEPSGACNPPANVPADQLGWWGSSSPFLASVDQCRIQDFPAGLHWLKYRSPINIDQPDDVEIVKVTNVQLLEIEESLTYNVARLRGFIHPMGVQSYDSNPLKVHMGAGGTLGSYLYINRNDSYDTREQVAFYNGVSYQVNPATRADGSVIFPQNTADHKYYLEMNSTRLSTRILLMAMQWSAMLLQPSQPRKDLTSEFLEPFNSGICDNYTTCLACLSDISCGWCPTSATCELRNSSSLDSQHCGGNTPAAYMTLNASSCVTCGDFVDCNSCAENEYCEWLKDSSRCFRKGRYASAVKDAASCPLQCYQRLNCSTCIDVDGECAWCSQTQTCFPFAEYVTRNAYGFCSRWLDQASVENCTDCSQHTTCKACLGDFNCGWCGNTDNPTIGVCLQGDYVGPSTGSNCSALISENQNISSSEPADWSYQVCPDIQECLLGLDDCHPNATCANTFDSYTCTCNRGFEGNGKTACDRTCYYQCIHGNCSGAPDYVCQCDLGWHGDECNTDCGCHSHSSCSQGVGLCDECQHWTMGNHCEICRPGSHGNAVTYGCSECDCNGHALESLGYCNIDNGTCYCEEGYQGNQCDTCAPGYYGDPRNGQKCYLKCEGRSVIANATEGAFGALQGSGVIVTGQAYCLWFITPYASLEEAAAATQPPSITLTIEAGNMNTVCNEDYIYVYDGNPSSLTASSVGQLVAIACGQLQTAISVKVTSGLAVIQFEASKATSGHGWFNATYTVHSCPFTCSGQHQCVGGQCVCKDGYTGINCEREICPNNCTTDLGQGLCDASKQLCVCAPGYTGEDCSKEGTDKYTEYTTLLSPAFGTQDSLDLQRMGHSLVHCEDDQLLVFGGFSLTSGAKNDMWAFNLTSEDWTLVTYSNTPPAPRWFHSAVCVPTLKAMYVLGGLIHSNAVASNELWKYTLDTGRWTQIPVPSDLYFPPVAGHSMTLVSDTKVMIIGGFSTDTYFANVTYELDVSTNSIRTVLNQTTGKGNSPTGIYSHSAVYHPDSRAVYVYGGYRYDTDRTVTSAELYALSIDTLTWSILPTFTGNHSVSNSNVLDKPAGRYGHTAVNYGDTMLVLGGYNGSMLSQVLAYNYKCNLWIDWTQSVSLNSGLKPALGQSAVEVNGSVYIFGGFDTIVMSSLVKLQPPADHCRVYTTKARCVGTLGCSACIVSRNGTNETFCYSNSGAVPDSCTPANSSTVYHQGAVCDLNRIATRLCEQHGNCGECLASWPAHGDVTKTCQWCSNCPVGRCVKRGLNCTAVYYPTNCRRTQQRAIMEVQVCVENMCQASDCRKCGDLGVCIWTRQFKRSSEVGRTLSIAPVFDWNCVTRTLLDATNRSVISMPPLVCPVRCYQHATCSACLSSLGSEGGWQRCSWSQTMNECMSPGYQPLLCINGQCGLMITDKNKCPARCSVHLRCSTCLSHAGCGWCALGGLDGVGVCMEGGLDGPSQGVCTLQNVSLAYEPLPVDVANQTQLASGAPTWAYTECPPENECTNGYHDCKENEDCIDEVKGYKCLCKTGYQKNTSTELCDPVCFGGQGCNQGVCTEPDVCVCNFGWVGQKCATECQCNKHSTCKSDVENDVCTECMNNTKGDHCELCKPLYVGNPINGGTCRSCLDYCNNHSSVCLTEIEYKMVQNDSRLLSFVPNWVTEGPPDGSAVCVGCLGNTMGTTCNQCKRGYYRLQDDSSTKACTQCQCQGHSDTCNADGGAGCSCGNNTKTPDCQAQEVSCHEVQCSLCKEYYLGIPTNGHQCYHKMTVDRDFCFDPETQNFCTQNPNRLPRGRTVFFAVQPRYLNVDIRVTIDVTSGGVDVFFSPYNDTFIVEVDPATWNHNISIDPRYVAIGGSQSKRRRRRDTSSNSTHSLYHLMSMDAEEMVTYVTIDKSNTILLVRNVQFRLVITLPHDPGIHNLKEAKFFTVLRGTGSSSSNDSFGSLYFRQDQPHIDLFVFFSVFFSSFFKFLSLCVLVWKIKQVHDTRRNAQIRLMEMEHMASRPFGKVMVYLDEDELFSQSPPLRRKRLPQKSRGKYRTSPQDHLEQIGDDDEFNINPIAFEPTDDGIAAVGTVVVQLPGGTSAPVQAYIGSALMTLRVMYPTLNNQKNPVRRRTTVANSGPNPQAGRNNTTPGYSLSNSSSA